MVAEQEGDREGAGEPRQHGRDGVLRRCAALDLARDEMADDLGVGLALELAALGDQLVAQRLEILDDAVVDQRHRPDDVRVGVADVGAPCVAQRVWAMPVSPCSGSAVEFAREIVELALGAAPLELAVIDRADAGAIIAAIFEPLEAVEQPLRDVALPDDADNSAHRYLGRLPGHPLAEALGPAGDALLLAALDRQAVGLDVLGDHRSGADDRAVADRHRRDQARVGADERPRADHRPILAEAVIIAGDRARADVGARADLGVADVGQ